MLSDSNATWLFSTTFHSICFPLDEKFTWLQFSSQLKWQALSSCQGWHNMELFSPWNKPYKNKKVLCVSNLISYCASKDSCSIKERPWCLAAVWSLLMDFIWLGAIISVNTVSTSLEKRQARKAQIPASSWLIFSCRVTNAVH